MEIIKEITLKILAFIVIFVIAIQCFVKINNSIYIKRLSKVPSDIKELLQTNGLTLAIPSIFGEDACDFSEELARVSIGTGYNKKWGFIDKTGKIAIPFRYTKALDFSEGYAVVESLSLTGNYFYIDKSGKKKINKWGYFSANSFNNGIAKIARYGQNIIDTTGKELIYNKPELMEKYRDNIHSPLNGATFERQKYLSIDDRLFKDLGIIEIDTVMRMPGTLMHDMGIYYFNTADISVPKMYIDKTGKELKYDYIGNVSDGLCPVRYNEKWGYIDTTGKEVIPCIYDYDYEYDRIGYYYEGLLAVRKNYAWGFVDTTGIEVIPCIYDIISEFSEDLLMVKFLNQKSIIDGFVDFRRGRSNIKERIGYINTKGELISHRLYEDGKDFLNGFAAVKEQEKWGFIDTTGNEVIPCIFDNVENFHDGLTIIEHDGKRGYIDTTGKEVIPCIYDDAEHFHDGLAIVGRDGKRGCVDKTGKEIIPCIFDNLVKGEEWFIFTLNEKSMSGFPKEYKKRSGYIKNPLNNRG